MQNNINKYTKIDQAC